MGDGELLLAAIRANPADDLPRLVYADWLDEQVPCPDEGKAEFIRVQCELAVYNPAIIEMLGCMPNHTWEAPEYARAKRLQDREAALRNLHGDRWRRVPCVECGGRGGFYYPQIKQTNTCEDCAGSGDMGGLDWLLPSRDLDGAGRRPEVVYQRGFPSIVHCPRLSDAVTDSRQGSMTISEDEVCRPTPWLAAVCRHHPVEQVIPLDVEIAEFFDAVTPNGSWSWYEQDVPAPLANPAGIETRHPTRDLALAALGRAVVAFARSSLTPVESRP